MFETLENYQGLLLWIGLASVVSFLASVIVIPLIIAYLPADYFVRERKPLHELGPLRLIGRCVKNLFGIVFLIAGIVMLFIPGQGILTMLIGISMLDFPGKRRMQNRIIRMPKVRRMVDWCRKKSKREALEIPAA